MTAIVRTLPGLVDHDSTATGVIPVMQVVDMDANDYDVRLDLSQHVDLIALADAIYADDGPLGEWSVLMRNRSASPTRRLMAQADLRNNPAVRAALTVKLDPAEAGLAADSLAERLEQAALEPGRCEWQSGMCNRFATGDDVLCPEHLMWVQEHGTPEDPGSYDYADL